MSDTWRTSGREGERDCLDKQTEKEVIQRRVEGGIKGNRCTRKAFWLSIVPERELIFFSSRIDHCIGSPHNAAATSVRDQPWVRVRGPAGPRTVTKMSKISGYVMIDNDEFFCGERRPSVHDSHAQRAAAALRTHSRRSPSARILFAGGSLGA